MATITKTQNKEEISKLYERLRPLAKRETRPQYTSWQLKLEDMTVTAYTSGKVVYQGKDLSWLEPEPAASEPSRKTSHRPSPAFPQAGSDEVGTGDYFGPVTVAACYVDEESRPVLEQLQITDSKQMTDEKIREAGPVIRSLCPHSILVMGPEKYNAVHETHNIVDIKSRLHDQAWRSLASRVQPMPEICMVDQFVQPASYYKYAGKDAYRPLQFETKAESRYLAVAAASVLAREAFLRYWDQMEAEYNMRFQKGAGSAVDACGRKFVLEFGADRLSQVAKLHFKNTERIL